MDGQKERQIYELKDTQIEKQRIDVWENINIIYQKSSLMTLLSSKSPKTIVSVEKICKSIPVWKELFKCLDNVLSNVWSTDLKINLTTSTLSSCTCSFEGQATLNEYL